MRSDPVVVPGPRDVRGSCDGPPDATGCVVACPPHPEYGGNRNDQRLRAVSDDLERAGIACVRFDYGPWDGGIGELEDAKRTVQWAAERFDAVALFGYSFGGGIALLAAREDPVSAVSVLAPASRLGSDLDVLGAVRTIEIPLQVQYGTRDDRASWRPVVAAARDRGADLHEYPADHFFLTKESAIASAVTTFVSTHLA